MKSSIFSSKIAKALVILLTCAFCLGMFPGASFADPGPLSDGVVISAQVVSSGPVVPPTVTTGAPSGIGASGATLVGTLTALGDSSVTTEGFDYGLTTSYGIVTTSTSAGFGLGQFDASVTGLVCGTTYHYEAYATNGAGTTDGTDQAFTTSSCPITAPPVISPGGGDRNPLVVTTSTINFSGFAYPGATISIARDGVMVATALAASDGSFSSSFTGVTEGSYGFSLYATDTQGNISTARTFSFNLNGSSIVNVSDILFSPTIAVSSPLVLSGGKLTISGSAIPGSTVSISSAQFASVYTVQAGAAGTYSYILDPSMLKTGAYTIHATASFDGQTTPASKGKLFLYGTVLPVTPTGTPGSGVPGDLNGDGRVNLIDYSIMKYWYGKPNPPAAVCLSGDKMVSLKDFSILASDWTG